jgi:PEP-CTERM motif
MTRSGLKFVGAAVLTAIGTAALAQPSLATTIFSSSSGTINNGSYEAGDVTINGLTEFGTPLGQFNFGGSYSQGGGSAFTFSAWCVDFSHGIDIGDPNIGSFTFTTLPLAGSNNNVALLKSTQINQIEWLAKLGNAALTTNYSAILSAEYQYAIWSVEYGGTNVGLSGLYQVTPSGNATQDPYSLTTFTNEAAGLIAGVPTTPVPGGGVELISANSVGANQTLMVFVPEPASIAVLGMGMIGLGIARRRRRTA